LTTTRTIRFKADEAARIERFLAKNPFLDFSTLARLAIDQFIHDPSVQIRGLRTTPQHTSHEEAANGAGEKQYGIT